MKKRLQLLIACALIITTSGYGQNADILWSTNLGVGNGREYQAASFVVDSANTSATPRGLVVVSKFWDSLPVGTRRMLTVDQFNTTGNWLSGRGNQQVNVPAPAISARKIVKALTTAGAKRYYALGYVTNSPKPTGGFLTQSTNTILALDGNFNVLSMFKIHYNTINAARALHYLEFYDLIVMADGNLFLCGYAATSSTAVKRLLLCKVTPAGAVLWSGVYSASQNCHAVAYSAAQATSGHLVITGTIDSCSPLMSPAGNKKLLVARFNGNTGAQMGGLRYINTTKEMAGYKIVRLQNGAVGGSDRFMITGFIDVNAQGVNPNRQILLFDMNENLLPNTMFWVGGTRTELGNDLVFRQNAANYYSLFVTGYTNSYHLTGQDETYFLRVRYSTLAASNPSVSEFSTYPNTTYLGRYGLEIKKAAGTKFAILTNTLTPTGGGQNRWYTSMLIRDTTDLSGNCIRTQQPTITKVSPVYQGLDFVKYDTLLAYSDNWITYTSVKRDSICGIFVVDPKTATTSATNTDQVLKITTTGGADELAAALPGLNIYPNPAKDKLLINWNNTLSAGKNVQVEVFNPQMKRVQVTRADNGNNIQLSVNSLSAGVYFLRISSGEQKGVFRFVKQ